MTERHGSGHRWQDSVDLDGAPPGTGRNPSSWARRIPVSLLAACGGLVALYMALFQWGVIDTIWDPVFGKGTERVITSRVSESMAGVLHVPDAALGAFGYFNEAILALAGSSRRWQFRPWLVVLFGASVIPLGLSSVMLLLLQGLVIGAWCFPCLVTAVISLVLVILARHEVLASVRYLWRVWTCSRDPELVWRIFWSRPVRTAGTALTRERGGMWGRLAQMALGLWLLLCPFALGHLSAEPALSASDFACGGMVVILGLASFLPRTRFAHLACLPLSAWLVAFGWGAGGYPAAPGYQNDILSGLLLAVLSLIPNNGFSPPRAWREFLLLKARDR